MDEFKKLEEIGLQEVSNRTHIGVKTLKYMINSQFENLNRVTTIGFANILLREYGLDLDEWLDEAEKFWEKNNKDDGQPILFAMQETRSSNKILIFFLALLILVAILYSVYLFLDNKINSVHNFTESGEINLSYTQTPVILDAKKIIKKNIIINSSQNLSNFVKDENINQSFSYEDEKNISEINKSIFTKNIDKDLNNSDTLSNQQDISIDINSSYILPDSRLWIGIIYLDNLQRKSLIGDKKFTLDISRDQLITTGHGYFTLEFNNKLREFKSKNSVKFLIKNRKIEIISDKKFRDLDRGSLW